MTRGLFLFEIREVFYRLGEESNIQPHAIEGFVKALLEERAFDTYHSLQWKEAEGIALRAFTDGYQKSHHRW
jgi:hypothetical protein